jgi:hypothetical protein
MVGFRPKLGPTCHQKPNPSRETFPLRHHHALAVKVFFCYILHTLDTQEKTNNLSSLGQQELEKVFLKLYFMSFVLFTRTLLITL